MKPKYNNTRYIPILWDMGWNMFCHTNLKAFSFFIIATLQHFF